MSDLEKGRDYDLRVRIAALEKNLSPEKADKLTSGSEVSIKERSRQ
jgi:hypothetical protein